MDREELINMLSTTLLWEVISARIEELDQIPMILRNIGHITPDEIAKINKSEILDSESFDVIRFEKLTEKILITFEMPFILSLWSDKEQIFRVTAIASGKCMIPDIEKYDWKSREFENMDKEGLLLNKELVDLLELNYPNVEYDDVNAI
ncbi:hypothetical protein [Lacrimispora brassicae]